MPFREEDIGGSLELVAERLLSRMPAESAQAAERAIDAAIVASPLGISADDILYIIATTSAGWSD
jgi:hypothetical protein